MGGRAKYRSAFGAALDEQLRQRGLTQQDVATATAKPQPYISQTMNGVRKASARWANLVATQLKLSEDERLKLHAAAARDLGYEIPKK